VGEFAAGADAQGLWLAVDELDLDAGVGGAELLGDGLGGGAGEVDAEVDGRRGGEGEGAGEGALGAELLDHATGEPAGDRPAQGEGLERLAGGELGVEGLAVAVDRGEHRLHQPAQGALGVELLAHRLGLGDRHVGRAGQLAQLEGGDPQQLAQAPADALGLVGGRVDQGVEAGPVAQHPVDQDRDQAAVAAREVGAPREQVPGQHAVGEALLLLELA
jgi:hypothetical protein